MSIIDDKFQPLLGKFCWNVQRGSASYLTFEFGEPHLVVREPRKVPESRPQEWKDHMARRYVTFRGDWHLWIYMCHWEAYYRGELIGHAESSDETINIVAEKLDGQRLDNVSVDDTYATTFEFDLGGTLVTIPWEEEDEPNEQWMLFEPLG